MSGEVFINRENQLRELTQEAHALLQLMKKISKTQFHKVDLKKARGSLVGLLVIAINYYKYWFDQSNGHQGENLMFDFLVVFDLLIEEMKNLNRINTRLEVFNEVQNIKQRLYSISNCDTCMKFVKKLLKDAQDLIERLEKRRDFEIVTDYYQDLLHLLERIKAYLKNAKIQVAVESVSGVVTLGASVAAGVAGGISIAARAGAQTASTATAASCEAAQGASSVVSATAKVSISAASLTVSNGVIRGVQTNFINVVFIQAAYQVCQTATCAAAASQTAKILSTLGQVTNSIAGVIKETINYANSARSIETPQVHVNLAETYDDDEHLMLLDKFDEIDEDLRKEIAEKMLRQFLNEEDPDENHNAKVDIGNPGIV